MTLRNLITDPFRARRYADLQTAYDRLAAHDRAVSEKVATQDGCKEALTAVIADTRRDAVNARIDLDRERRVHHDVKTILIEQFADASVYGLAGGWEHVVLKALAEQAGVDLLPAVLTRLNEMSGVHEMPNPHLVDGPDAREHPDTGEAEAAPDSDDTSTETSDAPAEKPAEVTG